MRCRRLVLLAPLVLLLSLTACDPGKATVGTPTDDADEEVDSGGSTDVEPEDAFDDDLEDAFDDDLRDASGEDLRDAPDSDPRDASDSADGGDDGTLDASEMDATEDLRCDDGFAFQPDPPGTGSVLRVSYTDPQPLAYIDMIAEGPGQATKRFDGVTTEDPWTWDYLFTDLTDDVWTWKFIQDEPDKPLVVLAECQRRVQDTGEPQPLPDPSGGCDGKFCGDDDGAGGTCTDSPCRVVGTDLANPSPCGPSEQDSPWQTLDNAGCTGDGSLCKIWCPYEKCDGCPNGTEAVYVPSSSTSYETACKNACEALGACWDASLSLCRNPGDCGTPLGLCPWQ